MDINALCNKVIETSAIFVVGLDTKGRIQFFNKGAEKISGYAKDEVLGKDWVRAFVPKKQVAETKKELKRFLSKNPLKHRSDYIMVKNGEERFIEWDYITLKGENGKVDMIVGAGIDITEQKKAEEKYRALFEYSNDAICIADVRTTALYDCNRRAEELLGYTKKELLQVKMAQMLPKDRVEDTIKAFEKHAKGESFLYETEFMTKDGRRIPIEISSRIVVIGNKPYIQGLFRDITQRKQAEQTLGKKLEELKGLNKFLVGREMRIVELKKKITELEKKMIKAKQ